MDNLGFPKHMIAVVIPAYKVEDQISKVVENIPAWVKLIIVVDDASPDDTAKSLKVKTIPACTSSITTPIKGSAEPR